MILIDSIYINNSGGKVLLDYIVSELENRNMRPYYLFDARCINEYTNIPLERKLYLKASLKKRHKFYKEYRHKFSSVFCFGNIPPSVNLKVPVYTYFHHGGLLSDFPIGRKTRLKIFFKKKCIKYLSKNTNYFILQSIHVKNIFCKKLTINEEKCLIIPFFREINYVLSKSKNSNRFLYVSGGNAYKNHENLLKAWEILAKKNIYPELDLTVGYNYELLNQRINSLIEKGLKITNHGFTDVVPLYENCKYLIFPSFTETFGLGLIECAMYGCSIIASNLEYVYSVVKPSKVFDPYSPQAIAQVVEYCLTNKIGETKLVVKNQINELIELISNETNNSRP